SLRQFLTNTTTTGGPAPSGPAGVGQTAVNTRSDGTPLAGALPALQASSTDAPATIDLTGWFTDPDITNSQVRLDTNAGPINVTLFDTTAPKTVQNFYNYI